MLRALIIVFKSTYLKAQQHRGRCQMKTSVIFNVIIPVLLVVVVTLVVLFSWVNMLARGLV